MTSDTRALAPDLCGACLAEPRGKTLDLDQQLELKEFESGSLWLTSGIEEFSVVQMSRRLAELARRGLTAITLHVSSPGGSVYPALALYDIMRGSSLSITAIVEGFAASAASMIVLQAATFRQARPNARILIHEPRRFGFGIERASDIRDENTEMKFLTHRVAEIMAERSGKPVEEVEALFERRERWMSAPEAQEFGLIDEVLAA